MASSTTGESPDSVPWYDLRLTWPLSYLPSIFRFLALVYIAPVIILSVFDVGGYLLFKLFYKPFGNYPMYSYFKQAPPRDDVESEVESSHKKGSDRYPTISSTRSSSSSSSEASSTLTSPTIPPAVPAPPIISIDLNDSSSSIDKDQRAQNHLRRRTSKKSKKPDHRRDHFDQTVGFEGPMLDFKSPTASDYEE